MISVNQLLFAMASQVVVGFLLGWFAHHFRQLMAGSKTATQIQGAGTGKTLIQIDNENPSSLLIDIANLVNSHAEGVKSFQNSMEIPQEESNGKPEGKLSNRVQQLRDANREFDEGVEEKAEKLADSVNSTLVKVRDSIDEHREKTNDLDVLLTQVDPNATSLQLKAILSEALTDVLDSKACLERELAETQKKLKVQSTRLTVAEQDARIDELTRLPNRRAFEELVANSQVLFDQQNVSYALLIFDVDYFKQFNDNHGHAAGDTVLQCVAKILQDKKRVSDHSFRYGGEEFVMLLPAGDLAMAEIVAERMRKSIEDMVVIFDHKKLKVTTSVGVAVIEEGLTAKEVLERADMALYRAKENGRNQTGVHSNENLADIESTLNSPVAADEKLAPLTQS